MGGTKKFAYGHIVSSCCCALASSTYTADEAPLLAVFLFFYYLPSLGRYQVRRNFTLPLGPEIEKETIQYAD